MRQFQAGLLALVIGGATSVAAQGTGPRRDGNWEITVEMSMPGMPAMPNMPPGMGMPAMKMTQCITKADAADPAKALPSRPQRGGGPQPDCKVTDQKVVGSTVTWSMACAGPQPMTGHGEMTYHTDSYTGTMTMQGPPQGGMPMNMVMKYTGKRLGDCNK